MELSDVQSGLLRGRRSTRGRQAGRHRLRHHLHLLVSERAARDFPAGRARILVTGGRLVGKTSFVGAAAVAVPATLPAQLLSPLLGAAAPDAPLDIGRLPVDHDSQVELWLVGTPGGEDCWPVWDVLRRDPGTLIGAVVLVDPRRPVDCRPALAYFRRYRVPYLLAVNEFDGAMRTTATWVRAALGEPAAPVCFGDARRRADARRTLTALVEHSLGLPGPRSWDG